MTQALIGKISVNLKPQNNFLPWIVKKEGNTSN
jgi:hypothetical protein